MCVELLMSYLPILSVGYCSFSDRKEGSFYINALVKTLSANSADSEINTMLTEVGGYM